MFKVNQSILLTTVTCGFVALFSETAFAGSHTWDVNEVFSNPDGTIQFIELFEVNGTPGETGVPGHAISSNLNSFVIPGSPLTPPTSNKFYLIATQAFANLPNAPTPDVIIPAGLVPLFFSINGDTITYAPWDSMTFGAGVLPIDGINSLNFNLTTGVNSPTNYAGVSGSVDATPPPTCTNVNDCSGNGTCVATDVCACDPGFGSLDCSEVVVPTLSQWGLAVMAILIACAGAVVMRRSRTFAV